MKDKSEKDSNFVDPEEEFRMQKEREEREKLAEDQESEASEMSDDREGYDAEDAFQLYKTAQQEIPATLAVGSLYG